jgi:hypothetical protein
MATAPLQHLLQQRRIWQGATFTAGHDMVNCQANIWASRCWCTIPIVTHIPTDRCCALRMTKQCTPLQRPIHGHPGTYSGQHTPSRTQQNSPGASALGLFTNRTCPAAAAVLATCWWNQLWVDQTPHEQNCCGTTAQRAQACAPRVPPQHQLQCTSTAAHTAAAHTAAGYDCQGAVLMCHFPAYSHSTRAPGPTRGGVCFFKMHEFNDLAKHANLHSVGQVASG